MKIQAKDLKVGMIIKRGSWLIDVDGLTEETTKSGKEIMIIKSNHITGDTKIKKTTFINVQ